MKNKNDKYLQRLNSEDSRTSVSIKNGKYIISYSEELAENNFDSIREESSMLNELINFILFIEITLFIILVMI